MTSAELASELPDFRTVFDQHWSFVWRVLQHLGVRGADVEDLGQEVFLVAHKRLSDFDRTRPVRPWLAGICKKVAGAHRRRAHVRREAPSESVADEPGWANQEQLMEDRDALRRLEQLLQQLPEEQRMVFLLHQVEQLPMSEVVLILECPLQTGYSRYKAALQRIQAAFTKNVGGVDDG
jgi:RNA polymerase sigma-70 factor (ECF subfamily)